MKELRRQEVCAHVGIQNEILQFERWKNFCKVIIVIYRRIDCYFIKNILLYVLITHYTNGITLVMLTQCTAY